MLREVVGILAEMGWFDPQIPYDKTVYLTHGAAQTLLLSRHGQPECFVKFSERSSLALEARRCEAAARQFPGIAPPFVGYVRASRLEVLATRAVVFRSLNAGLVRSARHTAPVQSGLEGFFRKQRESALAVGSPRAWTADYLSYFDSLSWRQAAARSLDQLLTTLDALPPQDQHGDFVVNNLGISQRGTLAVFDWEDYGAVDLPGLDLFTLDASLREEMDEQGSEGPPRQHERAGGLDVDRMCGALGLEPSAFERSRLGYAFVFRFLKRNYGPEIRRRVDQMLHKLGASRASGP